jgi:RimJ/RimL family protein N-acetyltransferase
MHDPHPSPPAPTRSLLGTEANNLYLYPMTQPDHTRPAITAGILIRPATTADLPTLLEFEQGVIKAERPMDPTIKEGPINYYNLPAMIASPDIQLLVAELDGSLIGSGYARIETGRHYLKHTHHAYIGFMYVDPAHRGKGVNQLIIDALRHWAHHRNLTELRLDVYTINEAAIRAYEKAGFTPHLLQMRSPV